MKLNPTYIAAAELWHLADEAATAWHMTEMFTTWALTGTPAEQPAGYYTYRWCFRSQQALLDAAAAWDPETMDEPNGYVKRKGERREAPHRLTVPEYNRRRCHHGAYVEVGNCPHFGCEGWKAAPRSTS